MLILKLSRFKSGLRSNYVSWIIGQIYQRCKTTQLCAKYPYLHLCSDLSGLNHKKLQNRGKNGSIVTLVCDSSSISATSLQFMPVFFLFPFTQLFSFVSTHSIFYQVYSIPKVASFKPSRLKTSRCLALTDMLFLRPTSFINLTAHTPQLLRTTGPNTNQMSREPSMQACKHNCASLSHIDICIAPNTLLVFSYIPKVYSLLQVK